MRNSLNRAKNILLIMVLILGSTKVTHAIDEYKSNSLAIEHKYNGVALNNVKVNLFKVAEISSNGDLKLDKNYKKYPININDIKEYEKCDIMSQTLATYTKLDNIKEYASGRTNNKGYVKFSKLEEYMYLVIVEDIKLNNKIISTKPFLVSIPSVEPKSNTLVHDVKSETKSDENEKEDLSVKKIWLNEYGNNTPDSIIVELYKNNNLYDTVELSEYNNWYYKWENLEKGYDYIIKEKNVPDNYYVTYEEYGKKVIITNTYKDDPIGGSIDESIDDEEDDYENGVEDNSVNDKEDYHENGLEDGSIDDGEDNAENKLENDSADSLLDNIIDNDDSVKDENDSSNKLPQTGTFWWPVPILLIAGMILIILGVLRKDNE